MAREMEETSSTRLSFPHGFSLLQLIIRACAGCLGFSSHDSNDPSEQEDGMTATEDRSINVWIPGSSSPEEPPTNGRGGSSINSALMASRRPQKPPPSEGRGGQINSASS